MHDPDATPSRDDVVNAYRLANGRDPEAETVIEDRLGQPNRVWFPPFFRSGEFNANVVEPIVRGKPLGGAWFGRPLPPALAAWAAEFIPLDDDGREAARAAADWHALFGALFGDARFARTIAPGDGAPLDPAFVAALEARRRRAARTTVKVVIEDVIDGEIHGWAIDPRGPDRVPRLELFIDGGFAGATSPDGLRPDLDHPGRPGFVLRYAAAAPEGRAPPAELRDAEGTVIASVRLPGARHPAIDALAGTRRDIADLRVALDRLEARLPELHRALGFPLSAWDAYAATYYPDRPADDPRPVDAAAVLDGSACDMTALDALLAGLFAQSARPRTIVVLHDTGDLRLEAEMLLDRWRARFGAGVTLHGIATAAAGRDDALGDAIARVAGPTLVLATAPGMLAPDAVALLLAAIGRGALLAYADDDALAADDGDRPRRGDPRLRSAFDPDLLLQQDCLGALAAIAFDGIPPDRAAAPIVAHALRLAGRGDGARIAHVPRVLFHRFADAPASAEGHHAAVRGFLARTAPEIAVAPHRDRLDAHVPEALSIRRLPPPGTRVAIVIPTRDRLDLLAPCLASIARSVPHNRVALEVVVVDNRSTEAGTRDFLAGYRDIARFRAVPYDGTFNWAAINNHAAAGIDADVLVFLNNDTVVLAPDCWDVLAAQAMRASVGAVGARLLYRDGTIQHAGMVTDPWHSFAAHEGVGDAGSDPGYLGRHALVRQVSTVTGACLATRAALFHETGGFDAVAFSFEGNDTDYCLRLRDRGYDILYDPGATLYHFESRTRGYNDDDAKRRRAALATGELRRRWAARFAQDRFYNPHFDRLAPACSRLAPPARP